MKRLTVALALLASTALAQSPATPPKPGPEQQRLAYFVGKWTNEADLKPSPMGPAGKVKGTYTMKWQTLSDTGAPTTIMEGAARKSGS